MPIKSLLDQIQQSHGQNLTKCFSHVCIVRDEIGLKRLLHKTKKYSVH